MTKTKIFTVAHLPDSLTQKWLQHLRDFDTANPDCHFEVCIDAPNQTLEEGVASMKVDPELVVRIFGTVENPK